MNQCDICKQSNTWHRPMCINNPHTVVLAVQFKYKPKQEFVPTYAGSDNTYEEALEQLIGDMDAIGD